MVKTPTMKSQKSMLTPKTLPKKLKGAPATETKKVENTRSSLRWPKLEMESMASTALAICTPARTTRSMAKVVANDLSQQLLVFTPTKASKRKSTKKATTKKSLARYDAVNENSDTDGTFVRPLQRKMLEQLRFKNVDESAEESVFGSEDNLPQSTPGRFVRPLVPMQSNTDVVASSDDELPSVSMLGGNLNKTGRYSRVRKSKMAKKDSDGEANDEELPSVSMLGDNLNSSGRFVRARKSKEVKKDSDDEANDEDLPSVSMLVTDVSARSRKSVRISTGAAQDVSQNMTLEGDVKPNGEGQQMSVSIFENLNSSGRMVRARMSKAAKKDSDGEANDEELPSVSMLGDNLNSSGRFVRGRKSKAAKKDSDGEANDEDLPSVSMLVTNDRKSVQNSANDDVDYLPSPENGQTIELQIEMVDEKVLEDNKSESVDVDNVNVPHASEIAQVKTERNAECNDTLGSIPKLLGKKLFPSRISVVDLTDSPAPAKKNVIDLTDSPAPVNKSVLNQTFTPEKESIDEAEKAKDRTFTEDEENNAIAVNDKTFSPVPSPKVNVSKKQKTITFVTPQSTTTKSLRSATKSLPKKKTPPLKRLATTPFAKSKGCNNLLDTAKMSADKKAKVLQTATELYENPAVFKFGAQSIKKREFRFSLVADYLKNGNPFNKGQSSSKPSGVSAAKPAPGTSAAKPAPETSAPKQTPGKSAVKPIPNFANMHTRMFNNIESIGENRNRHAERAKQLLSGKKPDQSQIPKPVEVKKRAKMGLNFNDLEVRRPLGQQNARIVVKARLNEEQRQERRMEQFKRRPKRQSLKKGSVPSIKGVRLNRRFNLMMQNRNASN